MGASSYCASSNCCHKTASVCEGLNIGKDGQHPYPEPENTLGDTGAEDFDLLSMSEPRATTSGTRRGRERRGARKRIGGRAAQSSDDGGETHLVNHRMERKKGKETKKFIKMGMKQDRVCALLEESELDAILDSMEYYEFSPHQMIVQQGKVGTSFFVTHVGTLEVSVNGCVHNTLGPGSAFGSLALLYNCPRTASVRAIDNCGVWGASGGTFHRVLQDNAQKHYAENRRFLDYIRLFDGLTVRQKDRVGEAFFVEVFEGGARVVTEGDATAGIYFVKKGELKMVKGGMVKPSGEFDGGVELSHIGTGDCFGESALLTDAHVDCTVLTLSRTELLCISSRELREVLGADFKACLERNLLLTGLKKSPAISQFSSTQQYEILKAMIVNEYRAGQKIEDGIRFLIVLEGSLRGNTQGSAVVLERSDWYEEGTAFVGRGATILPPVSPPPASPPTPSRGQARSRRSPRASASAITAPSSPGGSGGHGRGQGELTDLTTGPQGARIGVLSKDGLVRALKELGLSEVVSAEDASAYTQKMIVARKVHIFRHLSQEQTDKLVKSFVLQRYRKGAHVIRQGEVGSSFFVIVEGEVAVYIDGVKRRSLSKNAYFGERALLFDEPRTATVEVLSAEAQLWSVEKSTFSQIVKGNMQQELMNRIRLQDTDMTLKELKQIRVIGTGAAGVVRLVRHKKTQMRYALKRVLKQAGVAPEEVRRECSLLAETDHPFIMTLVKTFETTKSVYILSELITGGELHGAIRQIPTVLSRAQAQFYTGSLLIVLEDLSDKGIVYRDLKPENVMLDAQGYLKLIDFGIAKKLEEGKSRTFTMIGTPHYMAPEVMRGHGYGTEVDLWSLGVILFEFVCGYLPFADELEDPTEVCTAVLKDPVTFPTRYRDTPGRDLMLGLMHKQPKKRLGSGIDGFEEVKNYEYFKSDTAGAVLFNKIMGRELEAPVIPRGETYGNPEDVDVTLSDNDELG